MKRAKKFLTTLDNKNLNSSFFASLIFLLWLWAFHILGPPCNCIAHVATSLHKYCVVLHDLHHCCNYFPLPPSCVHLMHHFLHHFIIIYPWYCIYFSTISIISAITPPLSPSSSSLLLYDLHSFFIIVLLHYSIMLLHYSINPHSHYISGFYSSTGFMSPSALLFT